MLMLVAEPSSGNEVKCVVKQNVKKSLGYRQGREGFFWWGFANETSDK